MKIKEHLPKEFNIMSSKDEHQSPYALCGNRFSPIVINPHRDNDMSEDNICKSCRRIACPDCFGTGFMNGGSAGIYCSCKWGEIRAYVNGASL